MRNILYTIALLAGGLLSACSGQRYFQNPVIQADVPDPSVVRIGTDYYAAGTSGNAAAVYPLFHSTNLVDWQPIGHVFDQWPAWTAGAFWAPELFVRNGKTYCYYTARRKSDGISCIGVAVADSPAGPFRDHGLLIEWTHEAIDAFVVEEDGRLYITWKAYGLDDERPIELLGQRLSDDGLHLEGASVSLLTDDEEIGMEGQCIFKRGDYFYLLYAARDCCTERSDYEVRVARARHAMGPYEKYARNPILRGDGADFQSCGHGTLTTTPDGRLFYLCHAYKAGKYKEGRQPVLHELVATKDGWLRFKTGDTTRARQKRPIR